MSGRSVEHATFVVERKYAAPPERAFAAWADPEAKARWFGGAEAHLALDLRVGGRERSRAGAPRRMAAPTAMRRSTRTSSRPSASSTPTTCSCKRRGSQSRRPRWGSDVIEADKVREVGH
jgi:hypothetical protein